MLLIGIDPGVTTGLAVWDTERGAFYRITSGPAIHAEINVGIWAGEGPIHVYIEDARLRTWFGSADQRQARSGAGVREGVGSVKRDCQRWQEFCEYHKIPHTLLHPQAGRSKLSAEQFKKLTGWDERTNEHARDAAMLVYGRLRCDTL